MELVPIFVKRVASCLHCLCQEWMPSQERIRIVSLLNEKGANVNLCNNGCPSLWEARVGRGHDLIENPISITITMTKQSVFYYNYNKEFYYNNNNNIPITITVTTIKVLLQ